MADNSLRLAFIGCGGIARRHVVAMKDLINRGRAGFVITAVCDTYEANAQWLAQQLAEQLDMHPTVYTDYQELLKKEQLDGVDICLPHGLHHGVSIDCMEAGLHVLCEKPLGITIKACRAMAETADRTGKILSTAVPHRRQPGQRQCGHPQHAVVQRPGRFAQAAQARGFDLPAHERLVDDAAHDEGADPETGQHPQRRPEQAGAHGCSNQGTEAGRRWRK